MMRGCQLLRAAAQVMAATSMATSKPYSDAVVHDAGRRQLACVPVAPRTQRTCAEFSTSAGWMMHMVGVLPMHLKCLSGDV